MSAKTSEAVSSEARGRLKALRAQLIADYQRFEGVFAGFTDERLFDFTRKKNRVGRQRVFDKWDAALRRVGARLEGVRLDGKRPCAVWALLKARKAVLVAPEHERDAEPAIAVNFVTIGAFTNVRGRLRRLRGRTLDRRNLPTCAPSVSRSAARRRPRDSLEVAARGDIRAAPSVAQPPLRPDGAADAGSG
jgi:hypothetical protein